MIAKSAMIAAIQSLALFIENLLEALARHARSHAGALLLQRHRDAAVALAPAALHRAFELLERDRADRHRDFFLRGELHGERHVLVREPDRERRRVVDPREEVLGEPVEGALAARRALAQRPEQRERLHAALDPERENLGERRLHRKARAVVRELGDRARADRTDVEGLVSYGLQ